MERECRLGESVVLPGVPDGRPIWARVVLRPSWSGRVRSAFFKPPEVTLRVDKVDSEQSTYRFLPDLGSAGFLISPG